MCSYWHLKNQVFQFFRYWKGQTKSKKFKNHSKPANLVNQSGFKQFQQIRNIIMIFYRNFTPYAPFAPPGGSQYRPTFGQQYLENSNNKHCLCETFLKEYSTSFLMVCRLIDFALVVLNLGMLKVCVIIGISEIEFVNFSGTERVKTRNTNHIFRFRRNKLEMYLEQGKSNYKKIRFFNIYLIG